MVAKVKRTVSRKVAKKPHALVVIKGVKPKKQPGKMGAKREALQHGEEKFYDVLKGMRKDLKHHETEDDRSMREIARHEAAERKTHGKKTLRRKKVR